MTIARRGSNPSSIRNIKKSDDYLDDFNNSFNIPVHNADGGYVMTNDEGFTRDDLMGEVTDEMNRLDAIGAVYQRADRIITGDSDIAVTIARTKDMTEPSMTDGKDIILNGNLIDDVTDDTIIGLNGVNYHELAHVLFSPRVGSALGQYVTTNNMKRAFNVLEEGRIERLITTLYPSTTLTLEAMNNDFILRDHPSQWANAFATTTGRMYLPLELRQVIADKFIAQYGLALAQEVHAIVHEYRTLAFPTDFARAKELVAQLTNLIGKDTEREPEWVQGHGDRDLPEKGRPKSGKEQGSLQERSQDGKPETLDDKPTGFGNGIGNPSNEPSEEYKGDDHNLNAEEKALQEQLEKRMKEIKNDKRIARELKDTRTAILGNTDTRTKLPKANATENPASVQGIAYARRFGRELERIVRDNDPAWERFLPSGKLNISRTMNPDVNSIGEAFDVWDTGNDNTEIEATILIDNSGSMWGLMSDVCEQAWIIKRGIESINGSVSVYSFNTESKVVYESNEKAKPNTYRYVSNTGWTNPYRALIEAERTLKASSKPNKLFFAITDGQWSDDKDCNEVIKRMKEAGILTVVVYLSNDSDSLHDLMVMANNGDEQAKVYLASLNHGAHIFKSVSEPKHSLALANEIIKSTLNGKKVA
jgi:hypothetical protein